ncbi:MAG: hypothetical protein HY034_06410 [Nitrospirae bacterium]|nr:hypothetical protein [Nitrospirota bacterium]
MPSLSDKRFLSFFYILLLILPSCMFFGSSKVAYTKPAKPYKIDAPSGEWARLNIENIDAAYWNNKLKAGMAFGVDCSADRRGDINTIVNRLFIGLKERKIIESKEVTLNERNAATATAKGILNNKSITIKAYSIIDDNCIYDFAYCA